MLIGIVQSILNYKESEIMQMSVLVFRDKLDVAMRILQVGAMNPLDLVGSKNRLKIDKQRIAWLRANGHLKERSKDG